MKRSVLGSGLVALGLIGAAAVWTGSAWAGSTPCKVGVSGSRVTYTSFPSAVQDAVSGDTVSVSGTCYGNAAIVSKDLTIAGHKGAVLDAGGHGTVLRIYSGNVTVRGVTITNGSGTYAGGIYNSGTLTLRNSDVTANTAGTYGGGIYNDGTVVLAHSNVTANTAGTNGGGIYNAGVLSKKGPSKVTDNSPDNIFNAP